MIISTVYGERRLGSSNSKPTEAFQKIPFGVMRPTMFATTKEDCTGCRSATSRCASTQKRILRACRADDPACTR